jgi:hypothetical protein
MEINKEAFGVVKRIDNCKEIAIAQSKDGKTVEFKIKCKVKDLGLKAQDFIDLC